MTNPIDPSEARTPQEAGAPPLMADFTAEQLQQLALLQQAEDSGEIPEQPSVSEPPSSAQGQQQSQSSGDSADPDERSIGSDVLGSALEQPLMDILREMRDMIAEIRDRLLGGVS